MEGGGGAFFARSTIVMTNADVSLQSLFSVDWSCLSNLLIVIHIFLKVISNTANRGAGFFVEQSALTIDQVNQTFGFFFFFL